MHTVYLSLGANIGNRKRTIREAIEKIEEMVGVVVRQSTLYETKPWGFESPNDFINACICVETGLLPHQLLLTTQNIEKELGRIGKSVNQEYHDRVIDIDILLYDDLSIDEPDLKIPHPLMNERDFVMKPLQEILK
ncbi:MULTISPECIES: 2-amino-4-hydroxy-6-hydroxymethyldihydropteridine diphosphokinase [Segatella]|jgi:2-amino-4-hydroxy-6-hydroxymethyldihydropteridine diphosphokinase|uniref:2-amino-4-hydroxy-6-hydroxymethyldihydropteridine pyrophosphokinase n=2 Tax=Segatella TaxID=2974251 RepID=D8DVR2_9BACT|nr:MULTISPECIES: 2-amino-4-hydroxy-6-hydroxymethyldihydropteridine diphosphokinase [Segatella]MBQ3857594.1 2-amino-4-hydroxy-6-hydroxymethyldihydropteridine diphosphokinase [Prevotella sp.]EFI72519.1 2-amino-4-hydroxy-6-hydroxymethyldihydropteridine diphosphokinase [Segatella baroniae B14]MDR4931091.1 2-amino-4-hydroxy-6-hydroxymethyldihydropteridine diphosphokinase [Segatella bryantii]MEE3414269.1 2-amino-4-hydroxy-6-hydroxymethyldihydropteridine diphosphokinase [Prevotella sp.]OYP53965.1 2-a